MASPIRNICFCFVAAISLLLSGCSEQLQKHTVICDPADSGGYGALAAQILPESAVHYAPKGALAGLTKGAAVLTYDLLALPALEVGAASYWYPQYQATVVIAVDRNLTDTKISGWNDLLSTKGVVGISNHLPETRLLMASIAYGLEGEDYGLAESAALLTSLYKHKRLVFNHHDAPVLICFDYQSALMTQTGRNLEIIIPREGTLTFAAGLLSQKPLTLAADNESLLLNAGFRLPDGRTLSTAYPAAEQYQNAISPPDYAHLAEVCEDVTYVLKRDILNISSYLYSAVDGREQQLFALVFIILVILWTGYVMRRIMQKNVRRAILLIVILIIGWVLLRMFKYQIPLGVLNQYCWYGYYFFRLALPLVGMWISWLIDRPEAPSRPPGWWIVCAAVNLCLFLLVFSNNLHYMALQFDPDDPAYNVNYTYGPIYYLATAATFIQILVMQLLFLYKSWKSPRKMSFIFPLIFYALIAAYCIGYILRVPIIWETDSTIVSGVFTVFFLEACIRSGLIPVNTKYKALFEHSPLKMQLIASDGSVVLASQTASVQKDLSYSPLQNPQPEDEDSLLYQSPITGGTVFWQKDIGSIKRLHREIHESNAKLAAVNAMLSEEERIKSRLAATEARTALFTELEAEIKKKTLELAEMITTLPPGEGYQERMAVITLLLCYIKRRCILFFRERETDYIALDEIVVYLDELGEFAAFAGVRMHVSAVMAKDLPTRQGTLFYDFAYAQLDWVLARACAATILVQITWERESLILKVLLPVPAKDFCPDSSLLAAVHAAGGDITLKDMEDASGVWLSFPTPSSGKQDFAETPVGGEM